MMILMNYNMKAFFNSIKQVFLFLFCFNSIFLVGQNIQFEPSNNILMVDSDPVLELNPVDFIHITTDITDEIMTLSIGEDHFTMEGPTNNFFTLASGSAKFEGFVEKYFGIESPAEVLEISFSNPNLISFLNTFNLSEINLRHHEAIAKYPEGIFTKDELKKSTVLLNVLINTAYKNGLNGNNSTILANRKIFIIPNIYFENAENYLWYDFSSKQIAIFEQEYSQEENLKRLLQNYEQKTELTLGEREDWEVKEKLFQLFQNTTMIGDYNLYAFDRSNYMAKITDLETKLNMKGNENPVVNVENGRGEIATPKSPKPKNGYSLLDIILSCLIGIILTSLVWWWIYSRNKPGDTASEKAPELLELKKKKRTKLELISDLDQHSNTETVLAISHILSLLETMETPSQDPDNKDYKELWEKYEELSRTKNDLLEKNIDLTSTQKGIENKLKELSNKLKKEKDQNFVKVLQEGLMKSLEPVDKKHSIAGHIGAKLNTLLIKKSTNNIEQEFLNDYFEQFSIVKQEIENNPNHIQVREKTNHAIQTLINNYQHLGHFDEKYLVLVEELLKKYIVRALSQKFIGEMEKPVENLHKLLSIMAKKKNSWDKEKKSELAKYLLELSFNLYEMVRFTKFFEQGYKNNNYRPIVDKVLKEVEKVSQVSTDKKQIYTGSREDSEITAIIANLLEEIDIKEFNAFVEGYEIPLK